MVLTEYYLLNGHGSGGHRILSPDTIETPIETWDARLKGPILLEFRSREDGRLSSCKDQGMFSICPSMRQNWQFSKTLIFHGAIGQ
jgi:hypothetical protein